MERDHRTRKSTRSAAPRCKMQLPVYEQSVPVVQALRVRTWDTGLGHAGGEERLNFLPQADKIPACGSLSKDNISPWCWRVVALLASTAQPPALQPFTHVLLLFLPLPQSEVRFPRTHNVLPPCHLVRTPLSAHLSSRQRSRVWSNHMVSHQRGWI